MKMTLLSIVQNILSAMDSDEVNSVSDTVEAIQVALVVQETFYEQFNNILQPATEGLIRLDGLSTPGSPNYLQVPDGVTSFSFVRYKNFRNHNQYQDVTFIPPQEFLDRVLSYTDAYDHVVSTVDPGSGVEYYVKNNQAPMYYTSFDNKHIAFDSFDFEFQTTLDQSSVIAFGTTSPPFLLEDDFVPPLPDNLFPLLLAEAKSVCFINFKQISSTKEEQRARRQRIRMQAEQYTSKEQQSDHVGAYADFSRRSRQGRGIRRW